MDYAFCSSAISWIREAIEPSKSPLTTILISNLGINVVTRKPFNIYFNLVIQNQNKASAITYTIHMNTPIESQLLFNQTSPSTSKFGFSHENQTRGNTLN